VDGTSQGGDTGAMIPYVYPNQQSRGEQGGTAWVPRKNVTAGPSSNPIQVSG
jgi:hypothetical protein